MGSTATNSHGENQGRGFALMALIIGLVTGLAVYGLVEYWIDEVDNPRLSIAVLFFVVTSSILTLLLATARDMIWAPIFGIIIAAFFAFPNYFMTISTAEEANLSSFPTIFWFMIGGPLATYIMTTLIKANLDEGNPPPYSAIFFHGITLPLIIFGAKLFALLALVLLFAWAALLKSMDVAFFHNLFQQPWFILPFLGAIGGLSIAMMRAQQSVLGALRFILLLFSRIAMPIMAVFSLTFLLVLIVNGPGAILDKDLSRDFIFGQTSAVILFISFFAMLVFNGVYQNGEGAPPPAWLRIATIIAIASFPIYAGLASYALWARIGEYGLTPPRIFGAAVSALAFLYSFVCVAGLVTELNWGGKRWMPLVAKLNPIMAGIWVIVLLALATPIANPWAMSAKSQEQVLLSGKVKAADFDFGYLRFELGSHGAKVLDRLAVISAHPEAAAIREGVERARTASNRWEYRNSGVVDEPQTETTAPVTPVAEPMKLQLNPDDNPNKEEEDTAIETDTESDPQ